MMKKQLHYSILLLLLISSSAFCQKTQDVSLLFEKEIPKLSISNINGRPIVLNAIGYQLDSNFIYVKGRPKERTSGNNKIYTWKSIGYGEFEIAISFSGKDLDLSMNLNSNGAKIQPSHWLIEISSFESEYFTGIFERVVDGGQDKSWQPGITTGMNLRGESMDLRLKPTVSAYAPFFISSNNYGLFIKGSWPGYLDFCKSDSTSVKIKMQGPDFSFRIYRDENVAKIVSRHAIETGPSFVPPRWAFGPWRWRDQDDNNEKYYDSTHVKAPYNAEVVEDILMMQAFDVPCSAYWVDRPWGPGPHGYDDFLIDTIRFPQMENMIRWINSKNMEFMLWIGPFVMGKMATEAKEKGFGLVTKKIKNQHILVDFTNPEACKWWAEKGPAKLAKMGVKGFKLDRADGETELDSLHLLTSIGTSYRENFNDFPRQYVKATYDAVKPVLGEDFILFPRAQYTGSAQYGGMWAGDTRGFPEGLRSAVIALQRCAIMGYPIHGSDIGGYGKKFNRETTMRWLGFGCFSPIMEVGPTVNKGFWNTIDNPSYDIELIATWRLYSKLRVKLIDYCHSLAVEANKTGMPIARPLFLTWPEQPEAWNDWLTYSFGNDLLVSIVWEKGKTTQKVYLPKGQKWIDAWDTTKVYTGGDYIEVDVKQMYKTPVFIRQGSNIDLGDLNKIYNESYEIAKKKPNLQELEKNEGW